MYIYPEERQKNDRREEKTVTLTVFSGELVHSLEITM